MDATKPYKFIGFGAIDVTKPYELIGFGAKIRPGRPIYGSEAPLRNIGRFL